MAFRNAFRTLIAASLAAASLTALAAEDGTVGTGPGATSNGNFDITLTVLPKIIVTSFGDMSLDTDTATAGSPIEGTEDICVGGIGFANYSVNLSSLTGVTDGSGAGDFQLDGIAENLPYSAAFIDNTSSISGDDADTNGDVPGSFPRNGNLGCASENARVFVSIDAADWESANETSYSDTLTVTVTAL